MKKNKALAEMAELLKLLGDTSRLAILALLQVRELCVGEMVQMLEISPSNASQHLRKLRTAGLVREDKRGQWVYYSLNLDEFPDLKVFLSQLPGRQEIEEAMTLSLTEGGGIPL
ncbi:ArsR/SmtB family transcription factor [Cohnella faecalis]|uniref:ArsR family transcriptional regulator n=1 Tax=Cohnella faecalis TaxID=2315694 RepID=A0A398CR34_9BACL|nr:metalloregulator ArsR/SmtB family transcription factor [Cohnella faecalis]RIE02287.1 ArsR family transcriptional regulator [Cohnella faecalis]